MNGSKGAFALLFARSVIAAGAGVGGGDKDKIGRIADVIVCASDIDAMALEGLAKSVNDSALEFWKLI